MVSVVGKDPRAVKRVTCKNCGAILEYTKAEVREHHGTDYGGGPDGFEYIKCPQCTARVVLRS